jgi:hypothetical protein
MRETPLNSAAVAFPAEDGLLGAKKELRRHLSDQIGAARGSYKIGGVAGRPVAD